MNVSKYWKAHKWHGKLFHKKCPQCKGTGRIGIYRTEQPCSCNQGRVFMRKREEE